jgi:uncharacterized protein YdcH (DUF465 family)
MSNEARVETHAPASASTAQAEADRLRREHNELKARLQELNSRLYLSPAEELERKTIQKLKLAKKDRIAALLVSYSGNS